METKTFLLTSSFYPPYHIGGDAIHVSHLARELASRGHEVHVFFSVDAFSLKGRHRVMNVETDDGIHIHPCKSPLGISSPVSAYALGKSPFISKRFENLVGEVSPDIVHHHNISLLGLDILKKRRTYVNLYTAHDYWLVCPRNDLLYRGKWNCIKKTCLSCTLSSLRLKQPWRRAGNLHSHIAQIDRIIAPSKCMQSMLAQEFDNGFAQIYNFVPQPPDTIIPDETLNVDSDGYFLYVGVLEEHKGIRLLLDAFEEIKPGLKLVVVGDGSMKDYVKNRASSGRLKGRVSILGRIPLSSLYALYSRCLALVAPSIWLENCPMVLLEALSLGVPILGSNMGGVKEVIQLSESGEVFDLDTSRMREVLETVASDRALRDRYSDNAKASYARWFSPMAFMRAYEDEIRRIPVS